MEYYNNTESIKS